MRYFIAVVLAIIVSWGVSVGTAHAATPQLYGAHRGEKWPSPYTQDSSLAINAAIADPVAWFVESDARATKDGLGVMQHDESLTVSTHCSGNVADSTRDRLLNQCPMLDGSQIQTVEEYVSAVAGHKHAMLHVKTRTATFRAYLAKVLLATAGAQTYIRPLLGSVAEVKAWQALLPGWWFELGVSGVLSSAQVQSVKALGSHVRAMVIPAGQPGAVPSTWWSGLTAAHIPVDYVTYNHGQDVQSHNPVFGRVLSSNIPATQAAV